LVSEKLPLKFDFVHTRKTQSERDRLDWIGHALTVVMLSSDSESGVMDDVLRRCAVLRIFRFAACTMLATKRDDVSFWASLLSAVEKQSDFSVCQ
jgi:hypothetical protein